MQSLEIDVAWPLILAAARRQKESGEPLESKKDGVPYPILKVDDDKIVVERGERKGGRAKCNISKKNVETALRKLKHESGRLDARTMYDKVAVITIVVTLHPHLRYEDENGKYVVYDSSLDVPALTKTPGQNDEPNDEEQDNRETKRRLKRGEIDSTTAETLIQARRGQGTFRAEVLQMWDNCCAVSGSTTKIAIRASHIKPWRDSTDGERLDPHNGLPLIASLDALFDAGLISFEASGEMLVSTSLNSAERRIFGLDDGALSKPPSSKTARFLADHRNERFEP